MRLQHRYSFSVWSRFDVFVHASEVTGPPLKSVQFAPKSIQAFHPPDGVVLVATCAWLNVRSDDQVVAWLKTEGDKVEVGDAVLVVESDKADMDVEAYDEGYLAAIITGKCSLRRDLSGRVLDEEVRYVQVFLYIRCSHSDTHVSSVLLGARMRNHFRS